MFKLNLSSLLTGRTAEVAAVQWQALRWKRKPKKPFWLGIAKSKMFKVPEQPILPPEEKKELLRLQGNYYSAMRSIKKYFIEKDMEQKATQVTDALTSAEEIEESLKMNDKWNEECARVRAERLAKQDQEHEEVVMKVIDAKEEKKRLLLEKVEALVRLEKERSKDFVTRENLDEKIEECLNSHTDYNYAIDLEGNMYTGFLKDMKKVESENSASQQAEQANFSISR